MATNVQRSGFGFEKFFRRRSSSPRTPNELETNVNIRDEVANPSKETNDTEPSKYNKFSGQKSDKSKYESPDDRKDINDARKTDESKNSLKIEKSAASERQGEKTKVSEARQEVVIQNDVGQVKLAEIINNSIKEAVLNIVKEGVCPLADSLDRAKDVGKSAPSSVSQGVQDKENAPGTNSKHLPSLLPETNKTFDSHLCRSQYQPSNYSPNFNKLSDHERATSNKYSRELCPYVGKDRKAKSTKQKDKNSQDTGPKITRVGKGSSHFRTDNRRMTGNVNIYICSEANENTKDKKCEDKNKHNGDSETTSETKTCTSSLSVSTSKLVAALRKKRRNNLEEQPLNCLCNFPESSAKSFENVAKIGEDKDVLCPYYDEGSQDVDFLDTRSSSSRDCVCADPKFSNLDFAADSDLASSDHVCTLQDCEALNESASDQCSSYNHNDFWPCKIEDRTSYADDYRGKRFNQEQLIAQQDFVECCSCCNLKRCQKDRPLSHIPCRRESQERNDRVQLTRCPCIVEEENEDCCIDKEEPNQAFTVCGNSTVNEKSSNNDKLQKATEKTSTEFGSGILKSPTQRGMSKNDRIVHIASASNEKIIENNENSNVINDDTKTVAHKSSKTRLFSSFKRRDSAEREPKTSLEATTKVDQAKKPETKKVTEPDKTFTNDSENGPVTTNEECKRSFFHRSIKKAMGMLKTEKVRAVGEDNEKKSEGSPQYLSKREPNDASGADNIDKESHQLFGSEILNKKTIHTNEKAKDTSNPSAKAKITTNVNVKEKITSNKLKGKNISTEISNERPVSDDSSNPGKRSRSKICTAIATRRSSAATTTDTPNLSISQELNPSKTSGGATTAMGQVTTYCKFQKIADNCACCKEPEQPKEESCKSGRVASNSCVCSKKMDIQKTSLCCPTCRNPIDCCICCKGKLETVVRDSCNCCPRCRRPISECKCCCVKQEKVVEEYCDCCHNLQPLCCCDKNSRGKRSHPTRCRQQSGCKDDYRPCELCCKANAQCKCNTRMSHREEQTPKSMICIYCDNPQKDCICRAPIQKCAQCGLPLDVCNCKPAEGCECSGRVIVSADTSNEQTMSVTAWKPRRSIRRYFARNGNGENFEEDCPCYDNTKPYGSDELPYQKRGVFSTVMSELQQKMSGSICCDVCRKVPCCCYCKKNERMPKEKIERKLRNRETERRISYASQERSRSKSPARSCKCGPIPQKKRGRKQAPKICKRCQSSPCQCCRNSVSPGVKPQAKCYYCKNSPCTCLPGNEPTSARQFQSANSSHCRRTELGLSEKKINGEKENNGYQSRIVVPSSENQRNRKYCYRENSTKQYPLRSGERVG